MRPFPDVEAARWAVSTDGGNFAAWSGDGETLYFLGPSGLMAAAIDASTTFSWEPPEEVLPREGYAFPPQAGRRSQYVVSPDTGRILVMKDADGSRGAGVPQELVLVQNWFTELERLVPTE